MGVKANWVHATAVIGPEVRLGTGNTVGPYTVICGDVEIGNGNWIGPHVTIGTPAQYTTAKYELNGELCRGVRIGNRCVIREYSTVHQPSKYTTRIEDDCYLMAYCHVSHDTVLRTGVALANNTQIGGFSEIQAFATVGLSAVVHQYSTIGAYTMVGMATVINKDLPPFVKVVGSPARLIGVNTVGLQRAGFAEKDIQEMVVAYNNAALPQPSDEIAGSHIEAFLHRRQTSNRPLIELSR